MKKLSRLVTLAVAALVTGAAYAAAEPGQHLSFVSCPIVRDTRSVPCWLGEYQGSTYYLTIQSDVSAQVQPPYLGHQVLVEGIVTDKPSICGGLVLDQVHLSVMPELDANCNQMLPAEDRYTIDFNPRPPGPSGGRLAFDPAPGTQAAVPIPIGPQTIALYFDFDKGVSFRHPGDLMNIIKVAGQIKASRIRITGMRGAHLLSNGSLLQEAEAVGQRRAEEIAGLLKGAGLGLDTEVSWQDGSSEADGMDDWQSRRVNVELLP